MNHSERLLRVAFVTLLDRRAGFRPVSVLIYGAGGHAQVVADAVNATGWTVEGFYADDAMCHPSVSNLLAGDDALGVLASDEACEIIVAIGSNPARAHVVRRLGAVEFATVTHPTAIVSPNVIVGAGTFIGHGAIVGSTTTLGRHVIVNTGASVSDDCILEDFAHIAPRASVGELVRVGRGALVGAAATIRSSVRIGCGATIGAGTVVRTDVPDGVTVVGNPARIVCR